MFSVYHGSDSILPARVVVTPAFPSIQSAPSLGPVHAVRLSHLRCHEILPDEHGHRPSPLLFEGDTPIMVDSG